MDKAEAKSWLTLINELADGKQIQRKSNVGEWINTNCITFESSPSRYRVAPEPFECWMNVYSKGAHIAWDTENEAIDAMRTHDGIVKTILMRAVE